MVPHFKTISNLIAHIKNRMRIWIISFPGHLTFQLIELSDFMDAQFQDRYVDKVTPLLDSFHVKHGVVASYDIDGFRNGWFKRGSYCVLNAYDSPSNVDALYYSGMYRQF